MPSDINTAFTLLVIGMTTVFFILALVVGSGKILILIINRFFSQELRKIPVFVDQSAISRRKIAAIIAAVDKITHGTGNVIDIKKVKNG